MLFFPRDPVSHTLILFLWGSKVQVSDNGFYQISENYAGLRFFFQLSDLQNSKSHATFSVVCQYLPRVRSFLGVAIATGNPRQDLQLWLGVPVLSAAGTIKSEFLLFVPYISTVSGIVSSVRRLADSKLNRKSMQLFGWDFVTCSLDVSGDGIQSNFPPLSCIDVTLLTQFESNEQGGNVA